MGVKSELIKNFDGEIVEEFIDHLDVMSGVMEPIILGISNDASKVNELFRIFHNIKSASGFLQISSMNKVAHLTEEILDDVRNGITQVSPQLIDWLIVVSDQFQKWSEELSFDAAEFSKIDTRILQLP
jgi:two-component system chemotaxis sensor kinase CheA